MKLIILMLGVLTAVVVGDPALDQLIKFKNKTNGPISVMSNSNGAPIQIEDMSALNSPLIFNEYFMESMTRFVRERIPERVVHAKGAGAFGYFEVTHNVTDICKAKLFDKIGKKTPVAVRFSPTSEDKGESDTAIDSRGFAVKFYTEEGNFDMLGFHTPMFVIKDPTVFQPIIRVTKRNPVTNLRDRNMIWDFMTLRPESVFFFMHLFGDKGIPDGYRHMPGYSIHTYQFYNKFGESFFARLHMMPDLGDKGLNIEDAVKISRTDPDYAVRDFYNAIELGEFPSWTVSLQVLSYEDVQNAKFDVFDVTKILPLSTYPLRPLGKLVLNKNPTNYFADVELLAYCPCNLVPGILGGPDKLFEARRFAYRDAHLYRLGGNFNSIPVNCPLKKILSYDRDGLPPVGHNGGDSPSFYPNSFHGPVPYVEENRPKLLNITQDSSYNFDQAADMYNEMSEEKRTRLIANIILSSSQIDRSVQKRAVKIFNKIHPDLGSKIAAGLVEIAKNKN